MPKLSQEFVEKEFQKNKCKLLDKYISNVVPMKFKCSCGNISTISYKSLKRGSKCIECGGKKKLSFLQIKDAFSCEGYELMADDYKNCFDKMKIKCPQGHEYMSHWNNFQQGRRCPQCAKNKKNDAGRHNFEYVFKIFEDSNCMLLSNGYQDNHQKMKYKCECGNIGHISLAHFQNGHRCKQCGINKQSGSNHHNWIADRKEAKSRKDFRKRCNSLLNETLKKLDIKKKYKSFEILKYRPIDLKEHIVNHPNWNSVKNKKWHLDHIFPVKAFLDYGIKDMSLINCLKNLQPLEESQNLSKGSKYDKEEFEKWLIINGSSQL